MAIFGNKDKQGNFIINFCAVPNTPIYNYPNFAISATLLDDKIEFKQRIGKKESIYLEFSKITKVEVVDEKEIIEKDKSVAKRAIAGGLLLGPLGAIIGGIDGTGKKKKTTYKKYLVFNYMSDNEEKALPVEIVGATLGLKKFINELTIKCSNLSNTEKKETYL